MDILTAAVIALIAGGVVGLLVWILARPRQADPSVVLLQEQVDRLRTQLGESLSGVSRDVGDQLGRVTSLVNDRLRESAELLHKTHSTLGERLDNAARVVGTVQQGLGRLEEATRHIHAVGKDIASLQEILRAPKLRGGLGELLLGDFLQQILPPNHYRLQHAFKSGEKVDAVISVGDGLVPVDAKFPLENFRRLMAAADEDSRKASRKAFMVDVKKHIDAIATKYILPDEGTYEFALMYIPAENIYYETIIRDEAFGGEKSLCETALSRRVIPVSPASFYAYLMAIVLGLKGMRVEKEAQAIIQHLGRLQTDFLRFRDDIRLVGKHLTNAQAAFTDAEKRIDRFGERMGELGSIDGLPLPPSGRA